MPNLSSKVVFTLLALISVASAAPPKAGQWVYGADRATSATRLKRKCGTLPLGTRGCAKDVVDPEIQGVQVCEQSSGYLAWKWETVCPKGHVCLNNACVDPHDRKAQEKHLEKGPDGQWRVPSPKNGGRKRELTTRGDMLMDLN